MKSKIINNTLVKFLAVGVLNTIIGAGTMFLLYNLAHVSYWMSSAANYVVGGIVSFSSTNTLRLKVKNGHGRRFGSSF